MKLAILTSKMSPASGGLAKAVPGMAFGIDPYIDSVVVLGLSDSSYPNSHLGWGPGALSFPTFGPSSFGFAPQLLSSLRKLSPDIVDVQGLWQYPSLANLSYHKHSGTPYVVTPHGMLEPWSIRRSKLKKTIAGVCYEYEHLKLASCLRATADMEADGFRALDLRNPIAVIPNGVAVPVEIPITAPKDRRRLLFLSRLHPKKGIPLLLSAWARLEPAFVDWELVIAGPDELGHLAEMKSFAKGLKLKRLIWHPPVDGLEKDNLYRSSDLFVLPTYSENFGLVIAEALANGVPVITSRNAPWSGLSQNDCGWWINLSESDLTNALLQAMSIHPDQLKSMGLRGRAWMQRDFSWDSVSEKLVELYHWIAAKGSRPHFVSV